MQGPIEGYELEGPAFNGRGLGSCPANCRWRWDVFLNRLGWDEVALRNRSEVYSCLQRSTLQSGETGKHKRYKLGRPAMARATQTIWALTYMSQGLPPNCH